MTQPTDDDIRKGAEALRNAKVPTEGRSVMSEDDPRVFNPLATDDAAQHVVPPELADGTPVFAYISGHFEEREGYSELIIDQILKLMEAPEVRI